MDTAWEPSRPSSSGSEARRRSSRLQTPISTGESTQNIDQNVLLDKMQNIAGQARRSGRKRQSETVSTGDPTEEVMQPLTDEERRQWKGWVELESDPAHFNFILRQYGVKDVKIQEVLGLNDDLLSLLPKPTYGLIFLFKYRDDDAESGDQTSVSPNNIWFANQTSNNACATVALLNIVMNVPEVNLGYALGEFKEATQAVKPACRGYRLGYDDFVRDIHNSFARKMDMRNSDLALSNDKTAWKKAQAAKRRKTPARKGGKRKKTKDEDESGFHFIAYVPVNGEVWRLDGLQKEPVNLGQHQEDWMAVARDNIDARIGQYDDDGLQFNLLALCKSPLKTIPERLAETIRSILAVEEILNSVFPDWRSFSPNDDRASLDRPDEACDLSQDLLDQAQLSDLTLKRLEIVRSDPTGLLDLHGEWMKLQNELRMSYIQEVAMIGQENEQAARQQVDYTPLIYASIKTLAEEGILREIVKDVQAYED